MQRAWLREFNALGLQLRPQAAKLVTSYLQEVPDPQRAVELLVEQTKSHLRNVNGVVGSVIDSDVILAVIQCLQDASKGLVEEETAVSVMDLGDGLHVYNALTDVQPYDFDRATKTWNLSPQRPRLLPDCSAKSKIYADRFHILLQRMLLEGKLVMEAYVKANGTVLPNQRILTPVESLVGNPGNKLTFGLLTRVQEQGVRRWTIEDLHKVFRVELDVNDSEHLITDGCFVLAEGQLDGDIFRVSRLDVPAAVPRDVSLARDQVPLGVFGGRLTDEQIKTLERQEAGNADGMYVILCEVFLDSHHVLEKLYDLFDGYELHGPPAAYVFMGSFCSTAFAPTAEGIAAYRESFDRLKYKMQQLERHILKGTRFIFVPGPNDPGPQTLPRTPLPHYLTADLAKTVPNAILASNPCRIRHFSKEMVFFRHDVLRLLRRHEVVPLREATTGASISAHEVRQEMVQLLFDQAHLVPLPLAQSNILWDFDHTLRLYPLPHAVFIGGVSQPFDNEYQGARFCSVGSFHSDSSFYSFTPVRNQLDPCDVPDNGG